MTRESDIPFLRDARTGLLAGIARRRRRAVRIRRAALAAIPVALALAVIGATLPGGSSPALAIEERGQWIELRIADVAASEGKMEDELRSAGIDAEIQLVAVTEPLVGLWACIAEVADGSPAGPDVDGPGPNGRAYEVRLNEVEYKPHTLRISRRFSERLQDGRLVFVAGRTAKEGEVASADPCRDAAPWRPRHGLGR